ADDHMQEGAQGAEGGGSAGAGDSGGRGAVKELVPRRHAYGADSPANLVAEHGANVEPKL
ncbi:MAG: hypothetical protein LM598_03830, partial [Candidatus Verstraetearchaeota archaeon]|nr:hypothetical protein [Candidatus Verstraetearchaeota archaeon]